MFKKTLFKVLILLLFFAFLVSCRKAYKIIAEGDLTENVVFSVFSVSDNSPEYVYTNDIRFFEIVEDSINKSITPRAIWHIKGKGEIHRVVYGKDIENFKIIIKPEPLMNGKEYRVVFGKNSDVVVFGFIIDENGKIKY